MRKRSRWRATDLCLPNSGNLNPLTLSHQKISRYGAITHPTGGSDRIFPRHAYHKPLMIKFPDKCERKNRFNPDNKSFLVWFTDRSKTNKDPDAGL
jgi:hypothetical protein